MAEKEPSWRDYLGDKGGPQCLTGGSPQLPRLYASLVALVLM